MYYTHVELTEEEQELRDKLVAYFFSTDYSNILLGIEMLKQQKGEIWLAVVGKVFRIMYYLFHFENEQPEKTYGYSFHDREDSYGTTLRHVGPWCITFNEDKIEYFLPDSAQMMSVVFEWHDYLEEDQVHEWYDFDFVHYISVGKGKGRFMYTYCDEGRHAEQVCDDFIEGLEADVRKAIAHGTV